MILKTSQNSSSQVYGVFCGHQNNNEQSESRTYHWKSPRPAFPTCHLWEHNLSQTQTNLNNQWGQKKRSQSELKLKTIKLPEARENANDRFAIGLSVEFDWYRKWGEYSTPSHSEAEQTLRNPAIISILD